MAESYHNSFATSNSVSPIPSPLSLSCSSSWSSALASSCSLRTETPTVTELAFGLYRIHWQFSESSTEDGKHSSSFTIDYFPITLYNATTFVISLSRTRHMFGFRNAISLICSATSTSASAVPNWLPRDVYLEGGDENLMRLPPSATIVGKWGLSFWETKIKNSIVLLLQFNIDRLSMPQHLYRLLQSQSLCDVTFKFVCGSVYKAHRHVLCVGNEHFQEVFRNGFQDSTNDPIDIVDVPCHLFVDMLSFQYTGALAERYCSVGGFESLFEMYTLANRYVIHDLLSYCFSRLVAQIDFENALTTYTRCQALGLQPLKVAVVAFMSKYPELMFSLSSTITFVSDNSATFLQAADDIFRHLSN
jgi:hypothetical protein